MKKNTDFKECEKIWGAKCITAKTFRLYFLRNDKLRNTKSRKPVFVKFYKNLLFIEKAENKIEKKKSKNRNKDSSCKSLLGTNKH